MFKSFVSIILALPIFVTSAFAADAVADKKDDLQFKLLSVTDKMYGAPAHKIIASELKKGIFVTVIGGWSTTYQKTSLFVKEQLASKGIKVVDKPEEAEIGLQISPLSFQMEEVESGINAGIDKERVISMIGTAIFTNGISLLGETWRKNGNGAGGQVIIDARFFNNPKINSRGRLNSDADDMEISSTVAYMANKSGAEASTAAFAAYVEKLIENNFVLDAEHTRTAQTNAAVQVQAVTN